MQIKALSVQSGEKKRNQPNKNNPKRNQNFARWKKQTTERANLLLDHE